MTRSRARPLRTPSCTRVDQVVLSFVCANTAALIGSGVESLPDRLRVKYDRAKHSISVNHMEWGDRPYRGGFTRTGAWRIPVINRWFARLRSTLTARRTLRLPALGLA